VKRFDCNVKVPQIGWNQIEMLNSDLFEGVDENEYIYLVHSYYAPLTNHTIAQTNYGVTYSTALQKNNFYGTQFHPEKSSNTGEKILENFLKL
jgi:glutamine amidotransferase